MLVLRSNIRFDEGLMLETSALQTLKGGQFKRSTQLKTKLPCNILYRHSTTVSLETYLPSCVGRINMDAWTGLS